MKFKGLLELIKCLFFWDIDLANFKIPLLFTNLVQLKTMNIGSIVFAPLNQKLWPGKIISLGLMAQIQFFKIKTVARVPIKTLQDFSPQRVYVLLAQKHDKAFAGAIKMAQKELNQRARFCQDQSQIKKENPQGIKIKLENLESEKQLKPIKGNEGMKKEEEEDFINNYPVMASCVAHFLFQMNELELIQETKENKPKQVQFFNTATKQVEKYVRQPRFLLTLLTQKLMRKVWFQNNKSNTLPLEKRIKNILGSWDVDIKTILHSDFWKIINLTIKRKDQMNWITNSYIQALLKFKEKMTEKMSKYYDDYSQVGIIINRVAQLQIKVSVQDEK